MRVIHARYLPADLPPHLTATITALPEDVPVEGNASAWDDGTDEAYWAELRDRLDAGDRWAWCTVRITVTDGDTEGDAYLGCCSYDSADDFLAHSGYTADLITEALDAFHAAAPVSAH
jgi:hypothetical protein